MNIVSNASILINLARIGKLSLLHKLHGELIIPEAVWQEVVVEGAGQPGAVGGKTATWIKRGSEWIKLTARRPSGSPSSSKCSASGKGRSEKHPGSGAMVEGYYSCLVKAM